MTAGRNARAGLPQLIRARPDRVGRDRLEILTALINAPSFDPIFRPDVIVIPRDHPVYRWTCVVDCCERSRSSGSDLCVEHLRQLADARARGVGRAEFIAAATGLGTPIRSGQIMCRVCPERPADHAEIRLCRLHWERWQKQRKVLGEDADFAVWLAGQDPLRGYGRCVVAVCVNLANSPLGMCQWHYRRYAREGRPGGRCHHYGTATKGAGSPSPSTISMSRPFAAGVLPHRQRGGPARPTSTGCAHWCVPN